MGGLPRSLPRLLPQVYAQEQGKLRHLSRGLASRCPFPRAGCDPGGCGKCAARSLPPLPRLRLSPPRRALRCPAPLPGVPRPASHAVAPARLPSPGGGGHRARTGASCLRTDSWPRHTEGLREPSPRPSAQSSSCQSDVAGNGLWGRRELTREEEGRRDSPLGSREALGSHRPHRGSGSANLGSAGRSTQRPCAPGATKLSSKAGPLGLHHAGPKRPTPEDSRAAKGLPGGGGPRAESLAAKSSEAE